MSTAWWETSEAYLGMCIKNDNVAFGDLKLGGKIMHKLYFVRLRVNYKQYLKTCSGFSNATFLCHPVHRLDRAPVGGRMRFSWHVKLRLSHISQQNIRFLNRGRKFPIIVFIRITGV